MTNPRTGKRALSADDIVRRVAKRQKAWLGRARPGADPRAWRPFKVHRAASKRWLDGVDLQFQVSTARSGLKSFTKNSEDQRWTLWQTWPYIVIDTDLGSDALCGYMALERFFGANCDLSPGPAHGLHNDIKLSLSGCQLYGYWITMICAFNLPWGPEKDELRFQQVREACVALHRGRHPHELPMFLAFAKDIQADLLASGIELPGARPEEQEVFSHIADRGFCVREGRRISMCRFMASIEGAERHLPKWSIDCYETVSMALKLGLLRTSELKKLLLKVGPPEEQSENAGTTAPSRPTAEDRTFRGCFENAIMVRCAVYLDTDNRRLALMITSACSVWRQWHGDMSKSLRSCTGASEWWKWQLGSGFISAVKSCASVLMSASTLERCMFIVRPDEIARAPGLEVINEDEMAETFALFTLGLCAHRMRRCLHMSAFPYRMMRVLLGDEATATTVAEFKDDCEVWSSFAESPDKDPFQQAVFKRSSFHKLSVQQLREALMSTGWTATASFMKLIESRARLLLSTLPVEEMIGAQKNDKGVRGGRKFRRPEYSMAAAIRGQVLDKRCSFRTAQLNVAMDARTVRLDADSFYANKDNRSLPFDAVASTRATPEWYSPSAQQLNSQYADRWLLKA